THEAFRTPSLRGPLRPHAPRARATRGHGAGRFRARLQNLLHALDAAAGLSPLRGARGCRGSPQPGLLRLPDAALVAGPLRRLRLREERAGGEGDDLLRAGREVRADVAARREAGHADVARREPRPAEPGDE